MKRPNHPNGEETSEDSHKKKVRRISPAGRIGDEEGSGDLDLNATPLGFDLNAPVAEEDLLQAGSGWLSAQEEVVESKPDISEVEVKSPIPVEPEPLAQSRVKNEPFAGPESAQTAAVVKAEEAYEPQHLNSEEGIARLSPKEEEESDQGESRSVKEEETAEHEEKPLVTVPAVFRRPFEPLNTVTVDDDLDILRSVWSAWQQEDAEALDMTLVDTLEELAKNTHSPNRYLLFSCMYISKRLPEAFGLPRTFKVLLSFLESATAQAGLKRQSMLPIVACKLLFRAFAGEPDWPVEFVQLYLLDSMGSRSWIELEGCKEFVSNVLTAFPDEVQDVSLGPEDAVSKSSELQGGAGDVQQGQAVKSEAAVKSRYLQVDVQQKVRAEFCQSLNQLLGAASSKENPRQLLRLLMQGVGFEEVRVVASSMLEGWLNNPVHFRAAKGLLDRVLQHTRGTSENDFNTVANLLALRVPSGQTPAQIKAMHNNIFSDMISNLVRRRPEYATLALKTFVTAEMQSKNPHNIKCITTVLKAMPSDETPAEQELALILQELAASDESRCLLHDFVRRMMKQAGGEFDVHALCHGLIQPWQLMAEQDELLKEAWIDQLVDLTCQLLLHAAAPFVEDDGLFRMITSLSHLTATLGTSTSGSGLERSTSGAPLKDKLSNLEKFSLDTQNFQMMAMAWCTDVVAVYLPNIEGVRFRKIVRQLLFLEDSEAYFTPADSPTEVDMKYIQLLGACTRAPEEIVARLILMGISNFPVTKPESLDIIEVLVCRAAKLEEHLEGSLVASSSQLPAAIFKLASFDLRGVARQPVPQLVVKGMYWQACLVVLIVAVFNPSTIGRFVWENIPSLRSLMEVLITGCRMSQSNSMNAGTKLELEKSEADAEELDKKAEDAVSKFLAEMMRTEPGGVDNIDLATFEIEWKGKLMLLNQSGSLRRPPQAVYDKLDRFNDTYKLGHLLRKCHLPDYFSEVTALQTLQQAWPWVHNILAREPEVVAHFPIAWQCELLYMLEGSHPTTRKLSVDLTKLRSELRKVVSTPSKDTEIEIIINFLSHKLVAKSCALRHQSRRCLTSLFQTNPRHTDVQVSLPSSPREMKRTESTPGGTSRWQGPTLDTTNAISHHPKKAMAGASGSSSAHVSPGISPGFPVAMSNLEKTTQGSVLEDDTSWLKLLETLPTASRLISAFLPAIRLAMQQETSISVVVAYLIFLKKHAVPLPSWQSMACSLSVFIMQRKMLTASLLSGAPTLPPAFSLEYPELKSHTGIVDLIVESLSEALETGTVSDTNWEDPVTSRLPMVTFASRQYLGSEQVVRRVTLHKVVVEASLKVLSLLAFKGDEGYEAKHGFSKLLAILFPDTQVPVAWLEGKNGERMPLLGEDQAVLFSRSTVPKLIRAGLAELSLGTKLGLCEKLGLSPVASIALLQDLDVVTQVSLGAALGPRGFSGHRAKKLQNCVRALMQPGNPCGSRFLGLLEVYAASNAQGIAKLSYLPSSKDTETEAEDVARMDIDSMKRLSGFHETLADRVLQYLRPREMDVMLEHPNISAYFILRHISQQALLCSNDGELMPIIITGCVDALEHITQRIGKGSLTDTMCLFLTLPILYVLVQVKNERLIQGLCTLVSVIRRGVESRINNSSQGLDSHVLLNSILLFLNKSVGKIGEPRGAKRTGSSLACSYRDTQLTKLIKVPLHRFEGLLRLILHEKLKLLWGNRKDGGQSRPEKLGSKGRVILEMVDLLHTWRHDIGNVQQFPGLKEQVEWTGRYALISEFLMYLDPEFTSRPHFASIFWDSKVLREKFSFSLPNLALNFIIHSASWHTISWILTALLAECLKQKGETRMAEEELYTGHLRTDFVQMENGVGDLFKKRLDKDQILVEASSVLDFALLCMRHPRTVLACRLNDNLDPFEHVTEGVLSSFGPESVRALSTLAVADTMAVGSNIDMDLEDRDQSLNLHLKISNFGYPSVSSSRALKVLLVAACQGPHILSTIVKQLDALGQGNDADVLVVLGLNPERKKIVPKLVAGVAHELLMGLYQAFPVSVRTVLHVPREEKGPALHMFVKNHKPMRGNTRQTCALHSVLHRALRSICNGSEKEAKAAYGFCHDMARQHPTLVIPHLPTLTFRFKDMLPMVKQQDIQVRSTVARVYSYGIGVLDALRPHLLSNFENTDTVSSNKASLKIILGFYFEFLQHLEVQDKIYFSKVVARLADFLCHCVNAGGYYRDYVSSYRIPVIQPAAQTFGKIKKLGFLLGMLAKPADKEVPSSPDVLKSVSDEGKTLVVGGSLGPPALALEKVLKVESQLLQCLRWQGVKRLEDSRLELFDRRMTIPSIRYEMKKGRDSEELNLVAILEDLEKSSNRMPAILSVLEDSLLELTHISDSNVRDRVYVLLERLLLHCPSESTATNILQRLLQQLSSADTSLAKTAARQAPRFFYYCSELQEKTLMEMLHIGRFATEDDLQQLLQGLLTVCGGSSI